MTRGACAAPLPWEHLVAYWLADPDLDAASLDAVEEHLFACAPCAQTLAGLAALGEALRRRFRGDTLQPVITRATLAGLVA
ncbi:MAG TPA: zf-HC2 domain-containing protein, partial [Chloroflexota bacterium]|nr:zf-HC2 domain-containing protein [Chloroflexota bacterium]